LKNHFNTIGEALNYIRHTLANEYSQQESQSLSRLLLEHVLNKNIAIIRANAGAKLSNSEINQIQNSTFELLNHKPLQQITGVTAFYNIEIKTTADALIPRPETEELVAWVLSELPPGSNSRLLDVGTGTGCIAIALAKERPGAQVFAMDVSGKALALARLNAGKNGTHVTFIQKNVLIAEENLEGEFDRIISNPPYIPVSEKHALPKNVKNFEPELALFVPDSDPLLFYRGIEQNLQINLKKHGSFYFEIHENFETEISDYFSEKGYKVILKKDINGKARMVKAQKL